MVPFQLNDGGLSVVVDGTPLTISRESPSFRYAVQAIRDDDVEELKAVIYNMNKPVQDVAQTVYSDSSVEVTEDGDVYVDGEKIHNAVASRIKTFVEQDLPINGLVKFVENLYKNPSATSIRELYDFLDHLNMPITEDGCFLAYKAVRSDYLDKYSGTISNKPGTVVSVPRNKVDDNRENECSHGLHVGCLKYSGPGGWYHNSGDKVVIVKVNPEHVVSVPKDHDATKLRTCEYTVVQDYVAPLNDTLYRVNDNQYQEVCVSRDNFVDIYDVVEDDCIQFTYNGKTRECVVDRIDYDDDDEPVRVHGILTGDEKNAGDFRCFRVEDMDEIVLL